jgi:hypothetical protein
MLQYKASVLLAGHYYRRHHWMLLDGPRRIQESSRFSPSSLDTHPQSEDSGAFANFDEHLQKMLLLVSNIYFRHYSE